ncbi:12194_t:CDS:2 [Acaulospora colombiana]|uniref:12194_t:CDS:1 n=1 Tax=Acaulospora colombiana TaxID=27376 RepID=A0ACA9KXW5_9GLOM|nr:12194_t:CDS:2 [Acaulospora colombiana]
MQSYLRATGRSPVADAADLAALKGYLKADENAEYDEIIEVNLGDLEPSLNGPFTPDLATPLSKFPMLIQEKGWKDEVSAALIGSCTNSSYEDMVSANHHLRHILDLNVKQTRAAELANQAREAGLKTQDQSRYELQWREMVSLHLLRVLVLPSLPMPVALASVSNFKSRNDGNQKTMNFLASPSVVTAMAFSGKLSFNPVTDTIATPSGKEFRFKAPVGKTLPANGFEAGNPDFYPKPNPKPQPEVSIVISPTSSRLEVLEPFASHFANGVPAELPAMTCLMRGVNDENGEVNVALDHDARSGSEQSTGTIPEVAKRFKSRGQPWALVVDENYGEGCGLIVARSFARIHETNLKVCDAITQRYFKLKPQQKQGVLPLWFADKSDYSRISSGDKIETIGLAELLAGKGKDVQLRVSKRDGESFIIKTKNTMSTDQLKWLQAGSALNHIRSLRMSS